MKKDKIKKQEEKPKKRVGVFALIFAVNFIIIIAIFALSIFLNGIGTNAVSEDFMQYFTKDISQFLYLSIILLIILLATFAFLLFENKKFLSSAANVEMIFLIIEITLIASYASGRYINIYFRPLALGALLTLLLVNRKTAIFLNISITLIIFLMDVFTNASFADFVSDRAQYSSLIIGFTTGIVGVYLIDGVSSRLKVLIRGCVMVIPELFCLILLEQTNLLKNYDRLLAGASSPILSVVLFMAVLPIFEGLFKKVTNYRLAELTDHSSKLIKRLITEAPGTFNHSLVLSNLAESCAIAIGENPLLARCSAYYHDMGKLKQPEFFKENQQGGKNPHNDITPELSANIIKAHTKDGYEILKKNRLPQEVCDICLEHHGTLPILFFYAKAKNFADGGEVDIERYSYSGPKPSTKIAAIIMISDGAEAMVRSLKDRSRESVDNAVANLINDRMMLGQFDGCDITMRELFIIRNTIVNTLTGVYHNRVEYPKVNIEDLKNEENYNG